MSTSATVSVCLDPGCTRYLIDPDYARLKAAFESNFDDIHVECQPPRPHSPEAGATLEIVLTGVALGAGIVATEFLKEAGKKLWKSVEGMLKPAPPAAPAAAADAAAPITFGDRVQIELRVDGSDFQASVKVGAGDAAKLQDFLVRAPVLLYQQLEEILGVGQPCLGCRSFDKPPTEVPCRHCLRSGSKLLVKSNTLCTRDGKPLDGQYDAAARCQDFYLAAGSIA